MSIREYFLKKEDNALRGRSPKGLFVVDLDGTLLTDEKQVSPNDLLTLDHLRRQGYLVAAATGRSNFSFNNLFIQLYASIKGAPLPFDYIIFSTGAGIMDFPEKRIVKSLSLNLDDVFFILTYLEKSSLNFMIHRPIPDTKFFLFSPYKQENTDFHTRLTMYKDYAAPVSSPKIEEFNGATEVLCILPSWAHEVAAQITEDLRNFSVIKATSPLDGRSIWVEIFSSNASKGKAVKWLAQQIGIPQEKVCAVGNDFNDEDLLHWAGKSFIVTNSPKQMHAFFPVVASNNDGGVSEAAACWIASGPNLP